MIKKIKKLFKKGNKRLNNLNNLPDNYQILPLLHTMAAQHFNHTEDVIQILNSKLIMLCLTGAKIIQE